MENQLDFRCYLTHFRKSAKTNKAYSPKVFTDIMRRCRTLEVMFQTELGEKVVADGTTVEICEAIRRDRLGSTATVPYAHLSLINSVRIYDDYIAWRASRAL